MIPNYTFQQVAYPLSLTQSAPVGICLVCVNGQYVVSTKAARGGRRSSGVVVAQGAVNGAVFIQSFGDISSNLTNVGAGVACYLRVNDAGYLERALPIMTDDDIVGFIDSDGTSHLYFGVFTASLALIGGVGSMYITNPTTAGAAGTILPTTGRVFIATLNNTKNALAYVYLYDGEIEIARESVPANSTGFVYFANGFDLSSNLNFKTSTSLASFVADLTGLVTCSAQYAPAGAPSSQPVLSQLSPNTGPTAGGTSTVLSGVNFTGATQVLFDGIAGTSLVVNSDTQVTVVTPAHSTQSVNVTIVTPNGSDTLENGFTYSNVEIAPNPTAVSPTFGTTAGGTTIVITGTGFQAGATVAVGGTPCTDVVVNSSTQITCKTGAHAAANGLTLLVTNPSALSGFKTNAFSYTAAAPPTVVSISPTSGPIAGGTPFTLTTTNALSGAGVKFDSLNATSVTVVSPTSVTGVTPSHGAGTANVTLTNPDSQTYTLPAAFTYSAPPPTINPADYNLSRWVDVDDFNIGMQTCTGRASAGISGTYVASKDIGSAVAFGPDLNGKKCVVLGNPNGIKVADLESDMFSSSAYTFFLLIDVLNINPASDDAALFYLRTPFLAVASGGGVYGVMSADGNLQLVEYNGAFTSPAPTVSQAIPSGGPILICGRYDGTNLELMVNDGTPSIETFAGPLTPGASPVRVGYSGTGYPCEGIRLYNFIATPSYLNDTDRDAFIQYYNVTYGLGL